MQQKNNLPSDRHTLHTLLLCIVLCCCDVLATVAAWLKVSVPCGALFGYGLEGGPHGEERVEARFMPPEEGSLIKFKSEILCCFHFSKSSSHGFA